MKTFDDICAIEPRLRELYKSIGTIMQSRQSPWVLWSQIKQKFSSLVGWECDTAGIANHVDYDTVYHTMLAEAQRCRSEVWQ